MEGDTVIERIISRVVILLLSHHNRVTLLEGGVERDLLVTYTTYTLDLLDSAVDTGDIKIFMLF